MAALFLAKRAVINISRASSKDHPRCVVSANRAYFSTAFQRAQGTSVAAETRRETNSPDRTPGKSYSATNDPTRQGLYEAKQQAVDPDEYTGVGASQFVADTAKEGVRKVTQVADTSAKETMDGAREAAKEANQKIRETVGGGNDDSNSHDHNSHDKNNNNVEDLVFVEVHNLMDQLLIQ
ncbi:hypothetical protein H0E87_000469 [Populus deltoides]|uniref:Uncharacterized protein n=1 Tax=Populus deltoides TaxID=3696 RepID=A0A8T2ZMW7_POPDE|nr:hypothetical protein H0E87_000469 [Populus deltoides]